MEDKDIILVSGKTGEGVERLLEEILTVIPPPHAEDLKSKSFRALIFDFEYSNHEGVILYVRVLNGSVKRNAELNFVKSKYRFLVRNVGIFKPQKLEIDRSGQIIKIKKSIIIRFMVTLKEREMIDTMTPGLLPSCEI